MALCAVRAQAIWLYGLNPVQRWRYRHIPGPPPAWLLGNAVTMRRKMAHIAYEDWKALYGPVFRIFVGMQPFVVISGATRGELSCCWQGLSGPRHDPWQAEARRQNLHGILAN
jgi:hypothetical protein